MKYRRDSHTLKPNLRLKELEEENRLLKEE